MFHATNLDAVELWLLWLQDRQNNPVCFSQCINLPVSGFSVVLADEYWNFKRDYVSRNSWQCHQLGAWIIQLHSAAAMLVTQSPCPMDNPSNMLSTLEEENNVDIDDVFPPHVDTSNIIIQPESPTSKKQTLKTFKEVHALLQADRLREVKLILRENAWPLNNGIRSQLWPALINQHAKGNNTMEGYYWDMVSQVLGTTGQLYWNALREYSDLSMLIKLLIFSELPEQSIMLPPFVDSTHCLSYNLTRKGRSVADRIVSVLGYACPDIVYSPSLYPITALLLHFMPGGYYILNFSLIQS